MCWSFSRSKYGLSFLSNIWFRVSADILQEEIKKIQSYALLINKSIYWSHYFDVTEKVTVSVSCTNQKITPSDEQLTTTFRHFVSMDSIASEYFSLDETQLLTQSNKDVSFKNTKYPD